MTTRRTLIALVAAVVFLLSACETADSTLDDAASGNWDLLEPSNEGQYVSSYDGQSEGSKLPSGFNISQDEMNNFIQSSTGFEVYAREGSDIYFTDNYFHYSFSTENGELSRDLRDATGGYQEYRGIIADGVIFTNEGKLLQAGNDSEGWRIRAEIVIDDIEYAGWAYSSVLPHKEHIYFMIQSTDTETIMRAPMGSFVETDDTYSENGKIYKALECQEAEALFSEEGLWYFGIYEDTLIAVTEKDDYWAIDLATGESTFIIDGNDIKLMAPVNPFAVNNEYIYFANDVDKKIERIRFDGTGREDFLVGMNGSTRGLLNISGGYLYHIEFNKELQTYCLYRTSLDNPDEQLILAIGTNQGIDVFSSPTLTIFDDWVYYDSYSYGYWRAKTDGTCAELITYAAYSEDEPQWDVERFDRHNIAAGYGHTVAIRSDGTVIAVGDNRNGQCDVSDWTDIVSIYASDDYTIGIRSDGTFCGTPGLYSVYGHSNSISYSIYSGRTSSVKATGQLIARIGDSPIPEVESWTNMIASAPGENHILGLRNDGTVLAVGENSDGQCDVSDWSDIVAIAAGDDFSVGVKLDGTVVGTGSKSGISWTNVVDISAYGNSIIALRSDGTVVSNVRNLDSWTDIVEICAGSRHVVGVKSDGTVLTAGDDDKGQCGTDDWTDIRVS